MCTDRRKMFGVADMSGDTPTKIGLSLTLSQAMGLIIAAFTIVGCMYAATSIAYGWMEGRTSKHYNEMITDDLKAPDGEIYKGVDSMIRSHELKAEVNANKRFTEFDRRLTKLEFIGELTYEAITGNELPDID